MKFSNRPSKSILIIVFFTFFPIGFIFINNWILLVAYFLILFSYINYLLYRKVEFVISSEEIIIRFKLFFILYQTYTVKYDTVEIIEGEIRFLYLDVQILALDSTLGIEENKKEDLDLQLRNKFFTIGNEQNWKIILQWVTNETIKKSPSIRYL